MDVHSQVMVYLVCAPSMAFLLFSSAHNSIISIVIALHGTFSSVQICHCVDVLIVASTQFNQFRRYGFGWDFRICRVVGCLDALALAFASAQFYQIFRQMHFMFFRRFTQLFAFFWIVDAKLTAPINDLSGLCLAGIVPYLGA
jgi:hypothetical protein